MDTKSIKLILTFIRVCHVSNSFNIFVCIVCYLWNLGSELYSFDEFQSEKVAKIDRFEGQCKEEGSLPISFHNLSFQHIKRHMIMSTKIIITHDLNNEIEEIVSVNRCRNKETLDSCKVCNKIKFSNCCEVLRAQGQMWTLLIESIKPDAYCPMKAGLYIMENGTLDANVGVFPIMEGWYWRLTVRSFVTKELLMCSKIDSEILVVQKQRT